MIIDFKINIKTYEKEILYKEQVFRYVCPKCGATHCWIRHAKYLRNISCFENNEIRSIQLLVLRLKCTSCNSTHVILPNDIIPYCIYTYSARIFFLYNFYCNNESVLSLAETYDVSYQLIYFFISVFNIFLDLCIQVLRAFKLLQYMTDIVKGIIIRTMNTYAKTNTFQYMFFMATTWMIFMRKYYNIRPSPVYMGYSMA